MLFVQLLLAACIVLPQFAAINSTLQSSLISIPRQNTAPILPSRNFLSSSFFMSQDPKETQKRADLDVTDELALQYRWSIWYSAPKDSTDEQKKWDTDRTRRVVEFGTVGEFWRFVNPISFSFSHTRVSICTESSTTSQPHPTSKNAPISKYFAQASNLNGKICSTPKVAPGHYDSLLPIKWPWILLGITL